LDKQLRSGVNRTHLILLIRGAKESHASIQLCHRYLRLERLWKAFPDAVPSFPCDGKFLNFCLGLQPPSAGCGYPYEFWSPIKRFTTGGRRNITEIIQNARKFLDICAEREPTDRDKQNCFSVVAMPVEFAIESEHDFLDTYPPGCFYHFFEMRLTLCSFIN